MNMQFELIDVTIDGRLATVVISNPPANVITQELYIELLKLSEAVATNPDLTVILFKSADPDFFLAHFDVELILSFSVKGEAERSTDENPFHQMCQRFRTMDKIGIAQVEGRVGGGGNEIIANMDMRFGVSGRTKINQMEVPLGILPGGTGTQQFTRLLGKSRALELMLSGEDLDAETAYQWGYFNRLYAAGDIDAAVGALAKRIASYPPEAVRLTKRSVNGVDGNAEDGLFDETWFFQRLIRTDAARAKMAQFLEIGGQTREGELVVNKLVDRLTGD